MSSAPGHMVQMQVLIVKFPEVATVRKVVFLTGLNELTNCANPPSLILRRKTHSLHIL